MRDQTILPKSIIRSGTQASMSRISQTLAFLLLLLALALPAKAQLSVTNQLVLWLKSDVGLTADANGVVSVWQDQSGHGNHAGMRAEGTDTELPLLVPNAVNGKPAIRFDGQDDVLEIANSPSLQPQMNSWTVVFVGKRLPNSQGDFAQVIGARPWTAGVDRGWAIAYGANGTLGSHFADELTGHDIPAVRSASVFSSSNFQIWEIEENRAVGVTAFYLNGDKDRVLNTAMPVDPVVQEMPIHIGRDIGGANNRRANMEIAEILVYSAALSKADRESVTAYLSAKYGFSYAPNTAPTVSLTAPAPNSAVNVPAEFDLVANSADSDGSIRQVEFLVNGRSFAVAAAAPFKAPVKLLSPGAVTFSAIVTDNRGETAESAPVSVTASGSASENLSVNNGLQLWLKADAGVNGSTPGFVESWSDQSPNANNASQAADPAAQPELVANAINGKPAVRFDGVDDYLEIANSSSLQPGTGNWTVLFVGKRLAASQGDFPQVIGSRPWTAGADKGWAISYGADGTLGSHYADGTGGHDVPQIRSRTPLSTDAYQVWQVEEDKGAGFTRFFQGGNLDNLVRSAMPGAPIDQTDAIRIGREIGGADNRRANMDVAEILVYNRALSDAERDSVTAYLSSKYSLPAVIAANKAPIVALGGLENGATITVPANVTLTATASDADGAVTQVQFYAGVRLLETKTSAPYSVSVSSTAPGVVTYTAVAIDNLGASSTSTGLTVTNVSALGTKPVISQVDYSDEFTINAVRTDGLYNSNAQGAYNIEKTHGNPAAAWVPIQNFSFNTPVSSTAPARVGAATGNSGAAAGLAQSGGGDFNIPYGLRTSYVVQADAILPTDRLDISSMPAPGSAISAASSLTVFFRRSGSQNPEIGLYNGSRETSAGALTEIGDDHWHNFAVHFDKPNDRLAIYIDGILKTNLDLAVFAGGIYKEYSNAAVGIGGAGGVWWMDNFRVGAPARVIRKVDYSDTFTLTEARTDGLYNNNDTGAYAVEGIHGNTAADWVPVSSFSFSSPTNTTNPARVTAATGNSGAANGLAQTGGGDFSMTYGMRSNYVVQIDAILPSDRLDISSVPEAGGGIFSTPSLSIFFRRDSVAGTPHTAFPDTGLPGIGLFNGSRETAITDASGKAVFTGVDDNNWHTFAVHFEQQKKQLGLYVDGDLKALVDLATFAGGAYADYSNGAIGVGGSGGVWWMDNFQVGEPERPLAAADPQSPATRMTIRSQQNSIVIEWTGSGDLEEASSIAGPWAPAANASSPYSIAPAGGQRFYRIRQ